MKEILRVASSRNEAETLSRITRFDDPSRSRHSALS
jgi:hypothetical protein